MMRPSCAHREPSASFAASAVKTQVLVSRASNIVFLLPFFATRCTVAPVIFLRVLASYLRRALSRCPKTPPPASLLSGSRRPFLGAAKPTQEEPPSRRPGNGRRRRAEAASLGGRTRRDGRPGPRAN